MRDVDAAGGRSLQPGLRRHVMIRRVTLTAAPSPLPSRRHAGIAGEHPPATDASRAWTRPPASRRLSRQRRSPRGERQLHAGAQSPGRHVGQSRAVRQSCEPARLLGKPPGQCGSVSARRALIATETRDLSSLPVPAQRRPVEGRLCRRRPRRLPVAGRPPRQRTQSCRPVPRDRHCVRSGR
jgi:hypothetical protein